MAEKRDPLHIVLLHSNDIHGDFEETERDGIRTGGLSFLSGYLQKIRREEDRVVYAIAGDMFMGSIIDREYRGLSTIKLANALEPDVFEVGNHEVDYGLSHLLFLEKCADFPIICANMYVKELNRRLFLSHADIERDGVKIRFIGLLTESIADRIRQEEIVDSAVSVRPALRELKKVFDELEDDPADITILLTHIGIEEDKPLAEALDPDWHVDFIIGGHSHTFLQEPVYSGGVPIVQAGFGSDQIGRFDLTWDPEAGKLTDWTWQLIPVNEQTSVEDPLVSFYHDRFRAETNRKYDQTLFSLDRAYTHPGFHKETELSDLFADIYQAIYRVDVFFLSTNVIWAKELGPQVTRRDLMISFPYENAVYELTMTGERFLALIRHVYRKEAWEGANIFFLFSGALKVRVKAEDKELISAAFRGERSRAGYDGKDDPDAGGTIAPEREFKVGITGYAYKNMTSFLGIAPEEVDQTVRVRRLSLNDREDMESWLSGSGTLTLTDTGRLETVAQASAD